MPRYIAIAKWNGTIEIENLPIFFDIVSAIDARPLQGANFFNPNTGTRTSLSGATAYEPLTLESLLSAEQYTRTFLPWSRARTSVTGELSATHIIGDIKTTLLYVRYAGHRFGDIDKLSNDPSKLTLIINFEDTKPDEEELNLTDDVATPGQIEQINQNLIGNVTSN